MSSRDKEPRQLREVAEMSGRPAGKVCVITGTGGSMGRATALMFAREGASVVGCDVIAEPAQSVAKAAADVEAHEGRVDTLINNAGITGRHVPAEDLTGEDATLVFDTNVASIVRVMHAFLPLLGRSDAPAVINVTSGLGSFARTHDPERVESTIIAPLYLASKSAVTMLTMQYARALPGIRFNAADPGYTATDLNGHRGTQTVTEGTDAVVALATEAPTAGAGRFIDRRGPVPW